MERLDVYLCNQLVGTLTRSGIGEKVVIDSIARQIAALKKNIPALSDLAEGAHPSPVYHDIIQGIFARIRQLEHAVPDSAVP